MSELLTSRSIGDFHLGFGALFAIINPYGLAFVFLDRTMGLSERDRARIALRVAIYAFLVSLFAGSEIMRFFGISMPALRIAGGLVVAVTGWSVLNAAPKTSDGYASSSASYEAVRGMTFFPLTIPLTTGPGTIATAIAIGTNRPNGVNAAFSLSIVWLVIAFAVAVTIYHAYEVKRHGPALWRRGHQRGHQAVCVSAALHWRTDHDRRRRRGRTNDSQRGFPLA